MWLNIIITINHNELNSHDNRVMIRATPEQPPINPGRSSCSSAKLLSRERSAFIRRTRVGVGMRREKNVLGRDCNSFPFSIQLFASLKNAPTALILSACFVFHCSSTDFHPRLQMQNCFFLFNNLILCFASAFPHLWNPFRGNFSENFSLVRLSVRSCVNSPVSAAATVPTSSTFVSFV